MRRSVVTGLFACAIVFGLNSSKAAAAPLNVSNESTETTVVKLLSIQTETALQVLDEVKPVATEEVPQPAVQKHIVAEGESLTKIAEQYSTTWQRLYDKNTSIENPDILVVGAELVVPTADEQLTPRIIPESDPEQPAVLSSATPQTKKGVDAPRGSSSGNGYVAGYCTWYVKNRRPDLPNNLGNAISWVSRAANQGLATGSTPAVGAVGQRGNHVVYVESVNGDGTVTISEMNHKGRYVMTTRTLPVDYFSYIY